MKTEINTNYTQIPVFYTVLSTGDLATLIENVVRNVMSEHQYNTTNTLNPDELLTREEAAKEFKVSIATIDNYRREGRIIPCRMKGTIRFKRGDLQAAFSGNILNPYKVARKGKKA
jgi:hypothetical protein